MTAFDDCRSIEERSMAVLRPFIRQRAYDGQYVVTAKGPLARELQVSAGNVLFNGPGDAVYGIEIKAELCNQHGNLFLETWSNRARFTVGWLYTLKTDILLYHFIEDDEVWRLPFGRLREWAFHEGRIYAFPERRQMKHSQPNDTWGRCVPTAVLEREAGARRIPLRTSRAA